MVASYDYEQILVLGSEVEVGVWIPEEGGRQILALPPGSFLEYKGI